MSETYLRATCRSCGTAFRVRERFVARGGSKARCRVCSETFIVRHADQRPAVWLFSDDPAAHRVASVEGLDRDAFDLRVLDRDARDALGEVGDLDLPAAVVFGDMHVILEDALLKRCSEAGFVQRVLVSTHINDDLVETARSFCGFDHHVTLPVDAALLKVVLDDAVNATTYA